ncbi:hypothetical protein WMY93_030814 [Mugilogobius chulae]|uniref:Uncharacterized protein n=1 Tax=Mugilogobius chulae TaxID=88201 RepID=A0AAW0MIQ2_9GOBI
MKTSWPPAVPSAAPRNEVPSVETGCPCSPITLFKAVPFTVSQRDTLKLLLLLLPLPLYPELINVSSDGAEARRRLRECDGLVDALLHALQSAVGKKDMDNKSVENCVCIMRNLSYHVHKEVPGAEKFQDPNGLQAPGSAGPQRKKKDDAGCFGGKKAKVT